MKIAEVSKKYGVSSDTLRYYERIGLLRPVPRTASGVRDYGEADCQRIEFVKCMRSAGMPIEALIEYMDLFEQDGGHHRPAQGDPRDPARSAQAAHRRDAGGLGSPG